MAGYQFFHVECYAREESTKQRTQTKKQSDGTFKSKEVAKEKRGNIKWVIDEAKREQNSCYHIDNPQAPIVLMGNLDEVQAEATVWAEEATDAQGRKLRKDAHCLLAGVISLPRSEEENWEQFKAKSIDWLKEKYGENLRCVVEHQDEAHPHLHFYCVPKAGQSFDDLHEGKRAQKELKKKNPKATKQEQNIAFAEAMRQTQDDFSNRVGQRFGLARLGPGRRRLTRAQWQAEQKQAEALQKTLNRKKAYKKMFKEQALKEAQPLIAEAKEQAREEGLAEAQGMGAKVGGLWSGFKDKLSKPSERELQAQQEAQRAIAEAQRAKEQAQEEARKAKVQADNRVSTVSQQVLTERARAESLGKELDRTREDAVKLHKQLEYYKKNAPHLPVPK